MIEITRSLARTLKTIFRRTIVESGRGVVREPVLFHTGPEGLRVRIASRDAAAEYHDPRPCEPDVAIVPFGFLSDCEGGRDDPVQLEASSTDEVLATWNDRGVPQLVKYPMPDVAHHFPDVPESSVENPADLVRALHEVMQTASSESTRYALHCVQLRGASGVITATDGSQLLQQSGFEFPWEDDVLIPKRAVLGSKELPSSEPVFVGRSEGWVCFRVGSWSFLLAIEGDARFPSVEDHITDPADAETAIQIADSDAEFVVKSLKQLPGNDDWYSPVTVDANGSIAIRSQSEESPHPVELLLANSSRSGKAERFHTNRRFVRRALDLGFRTMHFHGSDKPVLCQNDRRSYVWMLLSPDQAIKPSEDVVRIESPSQPAQPHTHSNRTTKETPLAKSPQPSSNSASKSTAPSSTEELLDAAEQLKASLRDTLGKTNDLIGGLKRHRKEAKIVRSTLDSLRQLQTVS